MIYLDSSALVKRVISERESGALGEWLAALNDIVAVSSTLIKVEVVRAVAPGGSAAVARARGVIEEMTCIQMTEGLLDMAAGLSYSLRSLDAIHLASALRLGSALDAFVTYDHRLLVAAEKAGLPTVSPGAS